MAGYPVFDGIQIVYHDVHMQERRPNVEIVPRWERIIEIDHCMEGRIECSKGEQFFYLSQGDMAIHKSVGVEHNTFFPTSHYQGITIVIDLDKAPKCLYCFLADVHIEPESIMNRFCGEEDLFIARSSQHLEHVFAELYHVPEEVKRGYLKIKILEILLFLSVFPSKQGAGRKSYTFAQVRLAKEVCRYLSENMDRYIHIEQLVQEFHVSASQLQSCFRGVYGESVYAYIRRRKMQSAAHMLRSTDKSILEIANDHGYENGGKFASAFKSAMGLLPNEYRSMEPVSVPEQG